MSRDLVFVHGMWSHGAVWDEWLPLFESRGYRCRALTLPGHRPGDSDVELARVDFAACVRAVLREIAPLQRPVVIGHSLGGLIAQQVAAQLDLAAVVLINSAAPRAVLPLRPVTLPGIARHIRWGAWRRVLRLSAWEAGYLLWSGLSTEQRLRLFADSVAESGRLLYELAFGPLGHHRAHHVEPAAIRCRMLALAGSDDHITPRGVSRSMAAYYGDRLTFREIAGRAHWLIGEPGFEQRIAEILHWLSHEVP
jgi:pimeloyl-ACP methyl ester carboxylesterase